MKQFKNRLLSFSLACIIASLAMSGCGGNSESSAVKSYTSAPAVSSDSRAVRAYSSVVSSVGGSPVYFSGTRLFVIKDDDSVEMVQVGNGVQYKEKAAGSEALNEFVFSIGNSVAADTDAYGTYLDNSMDIYHWNLTDLKAVSEEVLVPAATVKEFIAKRAMDNGLDEKSAKEMAEDKGTDLLLGSGFINGGDGYLYKSLNAFVEDQGTVDAVAFGVMKISLDGKEMSFIDDLRAGSLAVGNGFIYYYDPGYTYDPKSGSVTFDSSKAGLYRALADGSKKTALISGIQATSSTDLWSDKMKNTLKNLRLINTELFYIDNSENGDNCLYKLSTDGGTPEKVSENKCDNYYYDREGHTLYYFGEDALWSRNMDTGEETELLKRFSESVYTGGEVMAVYGGYLYFADADRYSGVSYLKEGEPYYYAHICGERFNLKTEELEDLYYYSYYTKTETDSSGAEIYSDAKAPQITWGKVATQKTTSR